MKLEQVEHSLRNADPRRGREPSAADTAEVIRRAFQLANHSQTRQVRLGWRRASVAAAVAAAVAVLGVAGTAVAIGWHPESVTEAFSADRAAAPDPMLHPLGDQAVLQVRGTGPDDSEISLWVAPLPSPANGQCVAIVGSVRGAATFGKEFKEGAACGQGDPITTTFDQGQGGIWTSPTTGKVFWRFGGVAGGAASVEVRIPGKTAIPIAVGNGWYVGAIPVAEARHSTLVAFNANGTEIKRDTNWGPR